MNARSREGHLAMLAFSALVAGSFALGARAAPYMDPAALNAVRFTIALAVIGALLMWRGGPTPGAGRALWRYLVCGGLLSIYFVLMFEGLKTAEAVSASAVFTLTPIIAAVFGLWIARQRPTPRIALALAIGGVGALWVVFRGDVQAALSFDVGRGEVIYFWGCVAHAIFPSVVRRLNWGESALTFTFGTTTAALGIVALIGAPALLTMDWGALPSIVWVTIIYTGVFASAATFVLVQFAALHLPASKVMAYTYLVPTWVILWELAMTGALPSGGILWGVALVCGALLMLLRDEF